MKIKFPIKHTIEITISKSQFEHILKEVNSILPQSVKPITLEEVANNPKLKEHLLQEYTMGIDSLLDDGLDDFIANDGFSHVQEYRL